MKPLTQMTCTLYHQEKQTIEMHLVSVWLCPVSQKYHSDKLVSKPVGDMTQRTEISRYAKMFLNNPLTFPVMMRFIDLFLK